mmetsp:Transcript_29952/g.84481  ORF Transcript_29952/g.84481 Transcript_29952/m.84481 type:complete len:215 (+) Transcript_29952:346-990(+)
MWRFPRGLSTSPTNSRLRSINSRPEWANMRRILYTLSSDMLPTVTSAVFSSKFLWVPRIPTAFMVQLCAAATTWGQPVKAMHWLGGRLSLMAAPSSNSLLVSMSSAAVTSASKRPNSPARSSWSWREGLSMLVTTAHGTLAERRACSHCRAPGTMSSSTGVRKSSVRYRCDSSRARFLASPQSRVQFSTSVIARSGRTSYIALLSSAGSRKPSC